jgi:anti-sigma factor RsiW
VNCLPEETYSIYVDGELAPEQVREVESHLIQCESCRGLILALQEEGSLLADLLQERSRASVARVPARARARGLAIGMAPTLGLALLVASVGGWLLEQRLPPGLSFMNPVNLFGAYEMAFETIFMLRSTAPVLFDLGIAVGATVAMAAVLTFLMSAVLRRVTGMAAVGLVAIGLGTVGTLLGASPSAAVDIRWDQKEVAVEASEVLEDSLVVSAETLDIDGVVKGDVLALAKRVTIRGVVEGNVFAGAREVLVIGKIDGSLHMGCERCILEGEVVDNLYAAGEDVTVTETGRVGRDAHLFGEGVRMDGRSGRDLRAGAQWVEIRGEIGRNAHTHSERVSLLDDAEVGGNFAIEIPDHGESEVAPGAKIGGELTESVVEHHMPERRNRWMDPGFYVRSFVFLVSAFLVGLLLHALLPGLFLGTVENSGAFMRCLGYGFVALIATPVALVVCAITVVGIPIAILGVFVYLTVLFVSTVVVSSLVGSSITGSDVESTYGFGSALLLGLAVVIVLMNLPFVGGLLRLLIGLVGMGLVITTAREMWLRSRRLHA